MERRYPVNQKLFLILLYLFVFAPNAQEEYLTKDACVITSNMSNESVASWFYFPVCQRVSYLSKNVYLNFSSGISSKITIHNLTTYSLNSFLGLKLVSERVSVLDPNIREYTSKLLI